MKVYLVFCSAYLSNQEFLDVFATREAAEHWIETDGKNDQGIEYTIEEWEVRNETL